MGQYKKRVASSGAWPAGIWRRRVAGAQRCPTGDHRSRRG